MKKLRRVHGREVKRAFLIANATRDSRGGKKFARKMPLIDYRLRFATAKRKILALSEERLDAMIESTYPKRRIAIDAAEWYLGTFSPKEVGVWRRAGGLPLEWTNDSLQVTARHVQGAIERKSLRLRSRAKSAISGILQTNVNEIQSQKYLLPIVFEGGTGTKGRRRLHKKMEGDIDDGCMRSIALTISGKKEIRGYLGFVRRD